MTNNRREVKKTIKTCIIAMALIILAGYSFFEAKNLLSGPKITIVSPALGEVVTDPAVNIQGQAKNIAFIQLNDRKIFVNSEGEFEEELLLSQGYNVFKVSAQDKFNRHIEQTVEVVYKGL